MLDDGGDDGGRIFVVSTTAGACRRGWVRAVE